MTQLITTKPISYAESMWLVKWLRANKQIEENLIDQKFFVKFSVGGVINELKDKGITVTEKEILIGLRRLMQDSRVR